MTGANDIFQSYLTSTRAQDSIRRLGATSTKDLALAILSKGYTGTPGSFSGATTPKGTTHELSPIQRIMGGLSTLGYATAGFVQGVGEIAHEAADGNLSVDDLGRPLGGALSNAWSGLSSAISGNEGTGKDAPYLMDKNIQDIADVMKYSDEHGTFATQAQLDEMQRKGQGADMGIGGFVGKTAADIFTDPLTYVGPGLIKGLFKGGTEAAKLAEAANAVDKSGAVAGDVIEQGGKRVFVGGAGTPAEIPKPQLALPAGGGFGHASIGEAPSPIFDAVGKGSLFPARDARGTAMGGSPAQAARLNAPRGLEDTQQAFDIPQSALFNFNPNPSVDTLVANIAAHPNTVGKRMLEPNSMSDFLIRRAAREARAREDAGLPPLETVSKAPVSPVEATAPHAGAITPEAATGAQEAAQGVLEGMSLEGLSKKEAAAKLVQALGSKMKEPLGPGMGSPNAHARMNALESLFGATSAGKAMKGEALPEKLGAWLKDEEGVPFPVKKGGLTADSYIMATNPKSSAQVKITVLNMLDYILKDKTPSGVGNVKVYDSLLIAGKPLKTYKNKWKTSVYSHQQGLEANKLLKALGIEAKGAEALPQSAAKVAEVAPVAETAANATDNSAEALLAQADKQLGKEPVAPPEPRTVPGETIEAAAAGDIAAEHKLVQTAPQAALELTPVQQAKAGAIVESHFAKEVPKGGRGPAVSGGKAVQTAAKKYRYNPAEQRKILTNIVDQFKQIRRTKDGKTVVDWNASAAGIWNALKHSEFVASELGHPPVSFSNKTPFALKLSDMIAAVAKDLGKSPETVIAEWKATEGESRMAMNAILKHPMGGETNAVYKNAIAKYPSLGEYINTATQAHAINVASSAQRLSPEVAAQVDEANQLLGKSPQAQAVVDSKVKDIAENAGATPEVAQVIHEAANTPEMPVSTVDSILQAHGYNTNAMAGVGGDKAAASAAGREVVRGTDVDAGISKAPEKRVAVPGSSVLETAAAKTFFDRAMHAMATWYGNKTIYPIWQTRRLGFMELAQSRNAAYNALLKQIPQAKITQSWEYVKSGRIPNDPQLATASEFMRNRFESLLGTADTGDGLSAAFRSNLKGNSTVTRSGISMDVLNRELEKVGIRDFKFTNAKKVVTAPGVTKDFSNGVDWIDSWKAFDGADPLDFANRMEQAIQNALARKFFIDDLASKFGSKTLSATHTVTIGHDGFEGLRFEPKIASEINTLMTKLDKIGKQPGPLLRFYDNVLGMFKSGATIYNPSHHFNNLIGDTFMSWLAGVNNPIHYAKSMKMMQSLSHIYHDIKPADVNAMLSDVLAGKSTVSRLKAAQNVEREGGKAIISSLKRGSKRYDISAYNYMEAMMERGALPRARGSHGFGGFEDSFGNSFGIKPLGGYANRGAVRISEGREHFIRAAHFISKTEEFIKKAPKGLEDSDAIKWAFDKAAEDVRKWHPDGYDMTDFERQYMRRIFPFYSWTRKAIPLMVQSVAFAPGKLTVPNKISYNAAIANGVNPNSIADPFPVNGLFPDWMHDLPIGPQMKYDQGSALGNNPLGGLMGAEFGGLPFTGLGSQYLNNPIRGLANSLSPAFKIPMELATGHTVQTGAEIKNYPEWAQQQVPQLATGARITNMLPTGVTDKGQKEGIGNPMALLNWLTAAGLIDMSKPSYQKSATMEKAGVRN